MAEEKQRDTQCRKWLITINNPKDHFCSHELIKSYLANLKSVDYWCMADEIGLKDQTYHTHVFVHARSGIRFSTLKNLFVSAHLDPAKGTSAQNRDYVAKTGKWEGDPKQDTRVEGTFEESGTCPMERPGARNDLADLYSMIKSGMSDYEILEDMPDALSNVERLDKVRQIIRSERYRKEYRNLEVSYIFGDTGVGKTRSVMDAFGYENVYRVTDYLHPFDGYHGQDVLCFEEFRSSVPIADMLKYLDGYPLELPCRYNNKHACYTQVYIISNIKLHEQYTYSQRNEYKTWLAFLRRLNFVIEYTPRQKIYYDLELVHDDWSLKERVSPFSQPSLSPTLLS